MNKRQTDRSWPLPRHSHAMRMGWHDLLFMHWPVEPNDIEKHLPGIPCDQFDGRAWIGIVPFRMTNVAPRFVPALPGFSAFPELNVRTYVSIDGKPGVWFFTLDATNRIAVRVARQFFHLPYMDAKIEFESKDGVINYSSTRIHNNEPAAELELSYRPIGDSFFAEPGTLEYWLTARYCLYTQDRSGNLLRGEIDHDPWPLYDAEAKIVTNTMLDSFAIEILGDPHLLFSDDIFVKAWINQVVQ